MTPTTQIKPKINKNPTTTTPTTQIKPNINPNKWERERERERRGGLAATYDGCFVAFNGDGAQGFGLELKLSEKWLTQKSHCDGGLWWLAVATLDGSHGNLAMQNLGFVWLEGWKSRMIENGERIEKFLVFSYGVWFESKKLER